MVDDEKHSNGRGISSAEGKRLALVAGVNASVKSMYRAPLKYAVDDAYEMARTLESSACNFTLLKPALRGKEATTRDVKEAIIELIEESTGEDFLCFYFSGHAQPMKVKGDRQDVYLVTQDFSESRAARDPTLHLSMSWLWEVLYQQTEVRRLLLILDCCYAGNMLTTGPDPYQIDLYKLFEDYFEGENTKERANRSRFILSATGYDAVAHEQDGHGVMTGFLLKALRGEVVSAYDEGGYLDIYALYTYLQNALRGQQPNLSGEGRHRCLLAWCSPQSDTFRKAAKKADRVLITEADFFERLGEINSKPHKQPFDHALCKDASLADVRIEAVTSFFQRERVQQQQDFSSGTADQELLEQFDLMRESLLTYGALLCFGKNPSKWISGAFVRCIAWKGNDRLEGWEEERSFRGSLLEQFESGIEFLQRNLHLGRMIHAGGSVEQWEIPPVVLREALANALIHREYNDQTNFVQIEIFDNRIEINSPGGLPASLTIQQLGVAKQYPLRNPQIARIFYLCNYVEEAGSGIPRMQQAMREAGLPRPQFTVSDGRTFSVVLRRPRQAASQQTAGPLFSSLRKAVDSKQSYQVVSLVLATVLLTMLFISNVSRFLPASPISNPSLTSPIGVISSPDGEAIGISDGTFAFDTNRPDGQLKILAASALRQGNAVDASSLLAQATARDTNDAEALIYLEDQRVLASGNPYITVVVGTIITGGSVSVGRDDLQGAYIAQKEYNDGFKLGGIPGTLVRLLIANSGDVATDATTVAQRIVQDAQHDHTIVGVMGWPFSSYTLPAISVLEKAHIPMVSSNSTADELTGRSPYFFRVAPPNTAQAAAGVKYIERSLHAKRVALFLDPADAYSSSLAADFEQQFTADGNTIVIKETYTLGNPATASDRLQDALSHNPEVIYFSGLASDVGALMTDLPTSGPFAKVLVVGGDGLYIIGGYPLSARVAFSRLRFAALAYPDEWDVLGLTAQKPPFFREYPEYFNPGGKVPPGIYGFTRPDNKVMLAFDATVVMLEGCKTILQGGKKSFPPDDLRQALITIIGPNAIQGVSGQIALEPDGNPIDKAVVMLYVDADGHTKMLPVLQEGRFLKGA